MSYLEEVMLGQVVDPVIEKAMRARRIEIEEMLGAGWKGGAPRFYYGGSFGKKTMIAAHFDLDIVMYFAPGTVAEPGELYAAVERRLRDGLHSTVRRNVSLRLQYTPGWHVDVVPGRAVDESYRYADLYASELGVCRRTSLKVHIDLVRRGDRETIKVLKLWKWRNTVPVGSFVLELAAAQALEGCEGAPLEERVERVLRFLAGSFEEARLVDPANPENVVTDELHYARRRPVVEAAQKALAQGRWDRVVW